MTELHRTDDRLLLAVNGFARRTGWLHTPALLYATYGLVLVGVLLAVALWTRRGRSDRELAAAGWAPVAAVVALALNQGIGAAVGEARPYATHPGLLVLATRTTDASFPSDHAVVAGACAAGLWLVSRRLGVVAAVLAVLMAGARVYVAAHYPWDVAAGLLVGAGVALLGWWVLRRPLTALTRWLRTRPVVRSVFPVPVPARP
ncbi:phosphatase PAP2 family protein [Klenkia sp. PcliD-1-E]|uniref:phosphatase PAP2 family protein n=1 Tax=Klenkia sp. PcliD-1-E TaxID=2954492 RepID=UPI002097F3EA|nr:phosphatase PAP2 family protein [Klenkia sp. PcliD-1-E]MCO7221814.1 phosphatase PAP2 family protein [Klenkia sp. PcliD-1-E]